MTAADREHAAQLLLAFLKCVGRYEAIWAMTTALEELQEQSPSGDHVADARRAFAEQAVDDEQAKVPTPAAAAVPATRGKKSTTATSPAANGEQL